MNTTEAKLADFIPDSSPPPEPQWGQVYRPKRGRPAHQRPICARADCGKETNRADAKYCSIRCRNLANGPLLTQLGIERQARWHEEGRFDTPDNLREAHRNIANKVKAADWRPEVREAYNGYIRDRRRAKAEEERIEMA